jgi:hypothetical protein
MAESILPQSQKRVAPARLQVARHDWGDVYLGSADDLVAAGLVKLDQLPGQPGRPLKRVTYYRGQQVLRDLRRGPRLPQDEHRLDIIKVRCVEYYVHVYAAADERERRKRAMATRCREREEDARAAASEKPVVRAERRRSAKAEAFGKRTAPIWGALEALTEDDQWVVYLVLRKQFEGQ